MIYFTSDNMISGLPVYNYAIYFLSGFLSFSVSFFLETLKKMYDIYNIQNNTLCCYDMKNLSLRLG